MKVKSFSNKGVKAQDLELPKEYSGGFNRDLIDQAIRVYEDNVHTGLSIVKTRSQVIRTKKKLYRQKGTGGARHGAKSAPIFVGGGVAHGPKGVKRRLSLPLKMKTKARIYALSEAFKLQKVCLVDGLSKLKKTRDINFLTRKLRDEYKVGSQILIVLSSDSRQALPYFRNLGKSKTVFFKDLNAFDLGRYNLILIEKNIFLKKESKK